MILVLFGQPGSGKTTLANALLQEFKIAHNIDGDFLREVFNNKDYSREGRIKNLNRASEIAVYLDKVTSQYAENSITILSLVYPYKEARDYLNSLSENVKWVLLTYKSDRGKKDFQVTDFELPDNSEVPYLDTEQIEISECIQAIKQYISEELPSKDLTTDFN